MTLWGVVNALRSLGGCCWVLMGGSCWVVSVVFGVVSVEVVSVEEEAIGEE